jgi:regulator of ribonuclease activity A
MVLVIAGCGRTRRALLGNMVAKYGAANGWEAIVVFDAVRDTATLVTLDIPVKAFVFNTRPDIECS